VCVSNSLLLRPNSVEFKLIREALFICLNKRSIIYDLFERQ